MRTRGIIEVALAGLCFGFLGIFGRIAYRNGLELGELLAYRFSLAAILLALALLLTARGTLRISSRQLALCAALGILGYAVFSTLYFRAIAGVSVAMASLLLYTYPVFVALGARLLFRERLTKSQLLALPLALGGLVLLLGGNISLSVDSDKTIAILSGLASAFCYAAYILASNHYQKNIAPLTSGLYVMLFAALGLYVFHQPDLTRLASMNEVQFAVIAGLAVICTIAPLILFLSGLQKLGGSEASLLGTVEPLTAAVMGSLVLGEHLQLLEWLGGVLVLASLVITALDAKGKPADSRTLDPVI